MASGPAQLWLPASSMLAGNADRDRAVDVLRAGFVEGRLTQEEFTERVARAYKSRTYGELGELTADLPAGPFPPSAQLASTGPALARHDSARHDSARHDTARHDSARHDGGLLSPSPAGLALTALVVFALAAFITAVAVLMNVHGQPVDVPLPRIHLEPFVQYKHHHLG